MALPIALQVSVVVVALILLARYSQKKSGLSLPPGPKPLPIVGNIRDLPPKGVPEYQHWLKFKDKYGPISSITVLGQPMIILHDKAATHEILEKRSLKTSARPSFNFADLCEFNNFLPFRQYDETFRWHRKLIHQQLGTAKMASRFNDVQDVESRRFLLRILNKPQDLVEHIKTEATAVILQITYGYSIEPNSPDPLVELIEHMMNNLSSCLLPLHWMVDLFPFLHYIPEGLPGTSYKAIARKWAQINRDVLEIPVSVVKRKMATGSHRPSYVSSLLQKLDGKSDDAAKKAEEEAIKQTAGIMYGGGADTTVASMTNFMLAMTLFPDVQKRAQKEIEDVVGTDRLPGFEDRERLPYIDAVVKETQRWLPVTPIGTSHVAAEELTYGGYRIPKGSYLLPAIWWFLHDPETYSNPDAFDPGRYLAPRNEPDPTTESFGYGRRVCPGRFLATENIFIAVSRVLATFNISKAVDAEGREIEGKLVPTAGLISRPEPFPYKIEPRSEKSIEMIRSVEIDHPWEPSDARFFQGEKTLA